MVKLTDDKKQMFAKRNENAAHRMAKNAENNKLTEEQHEVLSWLCSIRHEMHTNQMTFFNSESADHDRFWKLLDDCSNMDINGRLVSVGLPGLLFNDTDLNYITDITYEDDDLTYDEAVDTTLSYVAEVNSFIEDYLMKIDNEHGTNYAPTGAYRLL